MENFSKLVSYLFHSRTQAHVFHLQTPSFAAHKALNDYYDEIIELTDGLIESYQGKYGIIMNYTNFSLMQYQNIEQVQEYFTALDTTIELLRQDTSDSYLQNQIDGVIELVRSTLYKLKYLK
jgi:hypothetical protein